MKKVKFIVTILLAVFALLGAVYVARSWHEGGIISNVKSIAKSFEKSAVIKDYTYTLDNLEGRKASSKYDVLIYDRDKKQNEKFTLDLPSVTPGELLSSYLDVFCKMQNLSRDGFPEIEVTVVEKSVYLNFSNTVEFLGSEAEEAFIENIASLFKDNFGMKEVFVRLNGMDYYSKNKTIARNINVFTNSAVTGIKKEEKDNGIIGKLYDGLTKEEEKDYELKVYVFNNETNKLETYTSMLNSYEMTPNEVLDAYIKTYIEVNGLVLNSRDFPKITACFQDKDVHINMSSDVGFLGREEEFNFLENMMNTLIDAYGVNGIYLYENHNDYISDNVFYSSMYDLFGAYCKEGKDKIKKEIKELENSLRTDGAIYWAFDKHLKVNYYDPNKKENVTESLTLSKKIDAQTLVDTYNELYYLKMKLREKGRVIPRIDVICTDKSVMLNFHNLFIEFSEEEERNYITNVVTLLYNAYGYKSAYLSMRGEDYVSDYLNISKEKNIICK